MTLPAIDLKYLQERDIKHSVTNEANMTCIVLPEYCLPSGMNVPRADLLLRLNPGYPDVPPDMWWFSPSLMLKDGRQIEATQVTEYYLGRQWQRWSRHFNAGQWRSGIDCLETFLALVRKELERCVPGKAV
jgi:hypothetical protein